jgi:hypothetical protein
MTDMRIGTRSLLYGIHAFYLHPWFVAWAWWRLYGFPTSFPLWVAFFVHDLGYLGKPNLDGVEGESHPALGGRIMARLFGPEWGEFTLCHSRHYASLRGRNFSQLCVADKLASLLYPRWLYLTLARLTGEMAEYRRGCGDRQSAVWSVMVADVESDTDWWNRFQTFMTEWVRENRDRGDKIPETKSNQVAAG